MNYIAEIRAFYDWMQFNALPADAQALWYLLMWLNNKCAVKVGGQWHWKEEFTVSNTTLISVLKFSRQQLDRMRNVLIQAGRIEYRKGRGSQSGAYRIIPFVSQYVTQNDTQPVTQTGHNLLHNQSTLDNNNNNFNNSGDLASNARTREGPGLDEYYGMTEDLKQAISCFAGDLFTRYFGRPASTYDEQLLFDRVRWALKDPNGQWHAGMDEEKKELLEYAFKAAVNANALSWSYIDGVLDNLRRRGLTNGHEAETYEAEREIARGDTR